MHGGLGQGDGWYTGAMENLSNPAFWASLASLAGTLLAIVKLMAAENQASAHGAKLDAIHADTNSTLTRMQEALAAAQAIAATAEELAARKAPPSPEGPALKVLPKASE